MVVIGGVLLSAGVGGCGAGAGLSARNASTLDAALESCDALLADADATAQEREAACSTDPGCDVDPTNAEIAQLYADAQASCDALVAPVAGSDAADGSDDGNDGEHKVTICPSTGSAHHPYVMINVDEHAIPAHERHHDGRDIIPAPADGCPAAADDDDGVAEFDDAAGAHDSLGDRRAVVARAVARAEIADAHAVGDELEGRMPPRQARVGEGDVDVDAAADDQRAGAQGNPTTAVGAVHDDQPQRHRQRLAGREVGDQCVPQTRHRVSRRTIDPTAAPVAVHSG